MPTHAGPNPALDSNIVFSYDVGDTINSYRGEPTTNLLTYSTNFSAGPWYGYCGNNSNVTPNTTDVVDPFGGFNATKVVRNNQTICDGSTPGWGLIYSSGGTLSANNTYTTSIWARCATGTMTLRFGISDFYGSTVTLTTEWQRFTLTSYYEAPAQTDRVFQFFSTDQNVTYYVCAAQTEPKDHATQYVVSGATNGIRSVTQGLLPLLGNTSLDISTVSFTSNAQITFDGTDDFFNIPINFGTVTQYTIEYVAFLGAEGKMPIAGRTNNNFYKFGDYSWYYTHGGVGDEFYHEQSPAITGYIHCVITYDGSLVRVWRNGYYAGAKASSGTANFSDGFKIGYWVGGGSYAWSGPIPIVKIYNVALSPDQVKQNYQQYKTRFNLS
jgi:hypothetical protein